MNNDMNDKLFGLYTLAELKYKRHFDNVNDDVLFPSGWYGNKNYQKKVHQQYILIFYIIYIFIKFIDCESICFKLELIIFICISNNAFRIKFWYFLPNCPFGPLI